MSKDQNTTSKEAVETVEKIIDYCQTTIMFWNLDKTWPTNLIYDTLCSCRKTLNFISVSDSHIIDK